MIECRKKMFEWVPFLRKKAVNDNKKSKIRRKMHFYYHFHSEFGKLTL